MVVTLLPKPEHGVDYHTESPRSYTPRKGRLTRVRHPEMPWVADGGDVAQSILTGSAAADQAPASQHVLIVANTHDREADLLAATIRARGDIVVRINIEDLSSSIRVTYYPNTSISEGTLILGDVTTSLADFSAAWAPGLGRGYFGHALDEPPARYHALRDWSWALCDLARWMPCLWVNDPAAVQSASDGLLQIRIAEQVGLEVPLTIMTNDPTQVRALHSQSSGDIITRAVGHYRCATNIHPVYACGQIIDSQALHLMDEVAQAPVIFQEHLKEWSRLRVYVVGGRVFPIDVLTSFRSASTSTDSEFVAGLPAEVEQRCRLLPRRLGLAFAAIDLARTREGRYLFLDLNPVPTWLWLEERTQVPITSALVDLLTSPHGRISLDQTVGEQLPYG